MAVVFIVLGIDELYKSVILTNKNLSGNLKNQNSNAIQKSLLSLRAIALLRYDNDSVFLYGVFSLHGKQAA